MSSPMLPGWDSIPGNSNQAGVHCVRLGVDEDRPAAQELAASAPVRSHASNPRRRRNATIHVVLVHHSSVLGGAEASLRTHLLRARRCRYTAVAPSWTTL